MVYTKPLPRINSDNRPFWEGCREHVLKIQKCLNCGFLRWPPAFLCPRCHSLENQWVACRGKGVVYTFAVYHTTFYSGFEGELPYVVAIVELDEGPNMMTNIIGCDTSEVHCGMKVEVTWIEAAEEITIPVFSPSAVKSHG